MIKFSKVTRIGTEVRGKETLVYGIFSLEGEEYTYFKSGSPRGIIKKKGGEFIDTFEIWCRVQEALKTL